MNMREEEDGREGGGYVARVSELPYDLGSVLFENFPTPILSHICTTNRKWWFNSELTNNQRALAPTGSGYS